MNMVLNLQIVCKIGVAGVRKVIHVHRAEQLGSYYVHENECERMNMVK